MLTLVCRETGLNCDYIIKGETEEDLLKNGAEHAIQVHGMRAVVTLEYLSYPYQSIIYGFTYIFYPECVSNIFLVKGESAQTK